jgi:hypothetical protein
VRGALFESWVASEVLKARLHRGRAARGGVDVIPWTDVPAVDW